jgi:hypothetical protein
MIYVLVIANPARFRWATFSLRQQTLKDFFLCEVAEKYRDGTNNENIVRQIKSDLASFKNWDERDYFCLILGDIQIPPDFIESATQNDYDIYGCPMLQAAPRPRILFGFKPGTLTYSETREPGLNPDGAICMKMGIAQACPWTADWPDPPGTRKDYINPFYKWARSQGYKVFNDLDSLVVHHNYPMRGMEF